MLCCFPWTQKVAAPSRVAPRGSSDVRRRNRSPGQSTGGRVWEPFTCWPSPLSQLPTQRRSPREVSLPLTPRLHRLSA